MTYAQIIARREECTRKARNTLLMFFGVCALGMAYVTVSAVHTAKATSQTAAAMVQP